MFQTLKNSIRKDTLFAAAVSDLLELVRVENVNILIIYIVEQHSDCFNDLPHDSYDKLVIRYDQLMDGDINDPSHQNVNNNNSNNSNSNSNNNNMRKAMNEREREEEYLLLDEQESYMSQQNNDNQKEEDADNNIISPCVLSGIGGFDTPTIDQLHELPPLKSKFESSNDGEDLFLNTRFLSEKKIKTSINTTTEVLNSEKPLGISFSVKKRKI
jgi:hypothetical protein